MIPSTEAVPEEQTIQDQAALELTRKKKLVSKYRMIANANEQHRIALEALNHLVQEVKSDNDNFHNLDKKFTWQFKEFHGLLVTCKEVLLPGARKLNGV